MIEKIIKMSKAITAVDSMTQIQSILSTPVPDDIKYISILKVVDKYSKENYKEKRECR